MSITGKGIAEVSETNTRSKSLEKELTTKSLTKAPLISISAIVGDLASDISTVEAEGETNDNHAKIIKEEETEVEERKQKLEPDKGDATVAVIAEGNLAISAQVETETEESLEEAQVVPVWEPDTQQDDQIAPVTQSAPQQKRDNNVNEVCPWEDDYFERMNDNVYTVELPLNRYNKLPPVTNFRSETLSIILSGVSQLIQHNMHSMGASQL
ncbi:hypothetical protein E2986_12869 [Frieseomelitta varia]|uniref:Uncharacterized protein n=1 Tax=Frieseomelitta varia TaxID=561572 RepID=A0A833RTS2_9HYME|nr:hypothetical protein E2986_12869 [Frieseomelitta varia]